MPMPTNGPWPPPAHNPAYRSYRDWDAWYTGNPDLLRDVYLNRGTNGERLPPSQRTRASQYAGGLVGTISRWLWGSPPPAGQRDGRLHVPLPADLAATAANLLFSEPPQLTHPNAAVATRLEQLVEDGIATVLLHAAEANSALGDVYLRPVIDPDIYADRAFLTAVHADGAIPTIRWGHLIEVTFWSTISDDGDVYVRLLEHHDVVNQAGRITYAVYEGTADQLGQAVSLAAHADTAYLADLVDDQGTQATGLTRLDVIRVPNSGPQRDWRKIAGLKYHGQSDFAGNEQWFDGLDQVWTNWLRDVWLARGRILVPEYMLTSNGPGMGATFDAEREVFTALNAMPGQNGQAGQGITVAQFAIRHVEHKATADAIVETALRHAGLSSQTLGEEGDGAAVTATEIQARERQSFTTRGNRIQTWRPSIADAVELLLELERARFGGGRPDPVKPNVEFGDSVSESPEVTARTIQLLAAAEAISTETKIRMVHPEWDDDEVTAEKKRIRDDATSTGSGPNPEDTLAGHAGNTPPGAGVQDGTQAAGAAGRQSDIDLGLFGT